MKCFNNIYTIAMAATLLIVGCGSKNSKTSGSDTATTQTEQRVVIAKLYDYNIVAEHPHSSKSYTQGLQYVDGVMWEGTGHEGHSHLQRIDLKTGGIDIVASLPKDEFGEGITHYKEGIYQLTWLSNKAYLYDKSGNIIKEISYRGEGWGITTDGERLFMSDGTSTIRQVNPETFATEKSI